MESIRSQRNALRTEASAAMSKMQQLEFAMIWSLERIAKALGLGKEADPEQIVQAAEGVRPLLDLEKRQTENIMATYAVLAENGLPSTGIVDGVRALAGRAQTALRDQKILADRYWELEKRFKEAETDRGEALHRVCIQSEQIAALEKKNNQLAWELESAKGVRDVAIRERDAWEETARCFDSSSSYYRGLLCQIGNLFGRDARIADDGTDMKEVLVALVPGLVEAALADKEAAQALLRNTATIKLSEQPQTVRVQVVSEAPAASDRPKWTRCPGGDCMTTVGFMKCWYRPGDSLRWCTSEWHKPDYPGLPGYSAGQVRNMRTDRPEQQAG